jgi:hypothetical protein
MLRCIPRCAYASCSVASIARSPTWQLSWAFPVPVRRKGSTGAAGTGNTVCWTVPPHRDASQPATGTDVVARIDALRRAEKWSASRIAFDPGRLSEFWLALLGYQVAPNYTDSIQTVDPHGRGPHILFAPSTDAKAGKNRLYFRPSPRSTTPPRSTGPLAWAHAGSTSIGRAMSRGQSLPTPKETSSAFCSLDRTTRRFDAVPIPSHSSSG